MAACIVITTSINLKLLCCTLKTINRGQFFSVSWARFEFSLERPRDKGMTRFLDKNDLKKMEKSKSRTVFIQILAKLIFARQN